MDDTMTVPVTEYERMGALLTEMTNVLRRVNTVYNEGRRHEGVQGGRRVRNDIRRQIEADRLLSSEFQKAMLAASPQLRDALA